MICESCSSRTCYPVLRNCLSRCDPGGFALEFGVQTGHSLRIIAERLPVVGFDSFQGLPEDWGIYPKGSFTHAPPVIANSRLVIGLFADTLPNFDFTTVKPLRLVHIDCDLYSSTKTVLDHVGPHLAPGAYVIFDDYFPGVDGGRTIEMVEQHQQRAWREFADRTHIEWASVEGSDGPWAIQIQ